MPAPRGAQLVTIDQTLDFVTVRSQAVNAFDDIWRHEVPPKIAHRLYSGTTLHMKLYDTTGTELPRSSQILFGVRKPGERQIREIWHTTYGPWAALSETEQARRENQGSLGLNFSGDHLDVIERQVLVVQILASVSVDWTDPRTFIQYAVEELRLQALGLA
jgi:hypothetical protein